MILGGIPTFGILSSSLYIATAIIGSTLTTTTTTTYEFDNGNIVQLQDPWRNVPIATLERTGTTKGMSSSSSSLTLIHPRLLGSGGGGAVFSYEIEPQQMKDTNEQQTQQQPQHDLVAVKFSWKRSADSVRNECNVLKTLEERTATNRPSGGIKNGDEVQESVIGVEQCLGSFNYNDPNPDRAVIVLQPVMPSISVSDISSLSTVTQQKLSVKTIVRTMAQMLDAGVVTTDVQPLISIESGQTILIDMTEAKVLTPERHENLLPTNTNNNNNRLDLSQQDIALVSGFCTEISTLVPEKLWDYASKVLVDEIFQLRTGWLQHPEKKAYSLLIDPDVQIILKSIPFADDDLIRAVDTLVVSDER